MAVVTWPVIVWMKSAVHQPLTPFERAALKWMYGILLSGIAGGIDAVVQYINNPVAINWSTVGWIFVTAAAIGSLHAVQKWLSAQNDIPLAALLDAYEQRAGLMQRLAQLEQLPAASPPASPPHAPLV